MTDDYSGARRLMKPIEDAAILDPVADVLETVASPVFTPRLKELLEGRKWLGHPLHPVLTDVPIGFWTCAWFLDFSRDPGVRRASDALVGLGVLSAVPTVLAGLVELMRTSGETRRIATLHGLMNVAATGAYAMSYRARRKGSRAKAFLLAQLGALVVTGSAYLGGELVYHRGMGVEEPASDS
jgi:uncharacterized membrane protein